MARAVRSMASQRPGEPPHQPQGERSGGRGGDDGGDDEDAAQPPEGEEADAAGGHDHQRPVSLPGEGLGHPHDRPPAPRLHLAPSKAGRVEFDWSETGGEADEGTAEAVAEPLQELAVTPGRPAAWPAVTSVPLGRTATTATWSARSWFLSRAQDEGRPLPVPVGLGDDVEALPQFGDGRATWPPAGRPRR